MQKEQCLKKYSLYCSLAPLSSIGAIVEKEDTNLECVKRSIR